MSLLRKFSMLLLCLIVIWGLPAAIRPASAQQPEKRIALVIGNGAYLKSPLATAANDAGLIAQTLQAAGFDVVGARDLDGDSLRKSFRDFVQKAEASGPETVAMVYLSGYGVQIAGENYFIPIDSVVNRDTDIPIEGLRISDYVRELTALRLKASLVVLDAARQQPFVEAGIASGLALVEAEPRLLIAFNAAPGTIAPAEPGPYGVYAQSLAEMMRTGGLSLPLLFDRLRLRVNEASKGAQVPWNVQKIEAPFQFFDRAADAPAQATPDQTAALHDKPIRDLDAQDAYVAALERDSLQGYEDFLAAYPTDPMAKRVRAIVAARREAITWRRSYRANTPEAYWSYLRRYPRGPHAYDARRRLAILTAPLEPPPSFAMIAYDVPPPPPDEIVYVDRPVLMFADPDFDFPPPPPPPLLFLPPPPPDFIVLPPPLPPFGLFILPQPVFVPFPVYVRAPSYVAPPPNNIIFANIHNTTVINTVINRPPANVPAGGAASVGAGTAAASAALPPSVAQRASLIQQGKLPLPPGAAINPAARASLPAGSAAAPNGGAQGPGGTQANPAQALPKTNALPVPGAAGVPPPPSVNRPGANGPVGAPKPVAQTATPPTVSSRATSTSSQPVPAPSRGAGRARPQSRQPSAASRAARSVSPAAAPARNRGARPVPPPPRVAAPRPAPAPARAAAPPPRAAPPPIAARPAPPPRPAPAARPAAPPRPAPKKCPPKAPRC